MTATAAGSATARSTYRRVIAVAFVTAALMCCCLFVPALAQTTGVESADGAANGMAESQEVGASALTYRNDVRFRAGGVWQDYMYEGLFGPDEHVLDRRDWSFALHYTHLFSDQPQDRMHGNDVDRRQIRAGRVEVAVTEGPVQATEPDEFRLQISGTGLVSTAVALGGRLTHVRADGSLYYRWGRAFIPEHANATMLEAVADMWVSQRVVLRHSFGGGLFTRESNHYRMPNDGAALRFGHELRWDVSPTFSYAHVLQVENWQDYHRMYDLVSRVELALDPHLIGSGGIRIAHFFTAEYTNEAALGLIVSFRYQPVPRWYAEISAHTIGALQLFDSKSQRDVQLAIGTRF